MPYSLLPNPKFRAFDANGDPLAGGKVYTYEPGTTTPKPSYTDNTGGTANANPVLLDANGEASIWLNGFYKIILKNSADVQQWSIDQVSSMPAESNTVFSEWLSNGLVPTYVGTTQFSVPGDETTRFQVGRRVKFTVTAGTVYGTITVSAYTTLTTVTVTFDSGSLDAGISAVYEGVLSVTNPSLPKRVYTISDGTAASHALSVAQLQSGSLTYASTSGTDTYTGSLAPAITAYTTGMLVNLYFAIANTLTTPTINLNGLGAKTIVRLTPAGATEALNAGDIIAGHKALLHYDGTYFVLLNPAYPVAHTHADTKNGGRFAGQIVQTVKTQTGAVGTGTTVIPDDDTIPQNTEGNEQMTLSITPTSATNKLLIEVLVNCSHSAGNVICVALFQDSTANALAAGTNTQAAAAYAVQVAAVHEMTAGTTSATTFKVRIGSAAAGTTTFNGIGGTGRLGGVLISSIRITEIQV